MLNTSGGVTKISGGCVTPPPPPENPCLYNTPLKQDLHCIITAIFNKVEQLLAHRGIQNITFCMISSSFWFFPRFPASGQTRSMISLARHITQPSLLLHICLVPRFHVFCRENTTTTDLRNKTGCDIWM